MIQTVLFVTLCKDNVGHWRMLLHWNPEGNGHWRVHFHYRILLHWDPGGNGHWRVHFHYRILLHWDPGGNGHWRTGALSLQDTVALGPWRERPLEDRRTLDIQWKLIIMNPRGH